VTLLWRFLRLALCGILLSGLLTACADNLGASEIARRYLDNVKDGNFSAAYDLLTADSQLKVSRSQFVDRMTRARQDAAISRTDVLRVQEPSIAGKRASVAYQLEITQQDGKKLTLYEAMVLLQGENGWRVIWPPQ
jgi:hypothetical protein